MYTLTKELARYLHLKTILNLFNFRQQLKYLEGSFKVPSGQGGCLNPGGPTFLAHTKQKVSNIVDLTVLRLAFFMGYK